MELHISSIDDIKLISWVNFSSSTHYESNQRYFIKFMMIFLDGLQVLYGDKKSRMSGTTSLDAQKWKRIGMKMGCGTREEK